MDHRIKERDEIVGEHTKVLTLDLNLKRHRAEHAMLQRGIPVFTDEMAFARITAQPKLAWVLGGATDSTTTDQPSIKRVSPDRPKTADNHLDVHKDSFVRRSKSSETLHSAAHLPTVHRETPPAKQTPRSNQQFWCIFCLKRFCNQTSWAQHEETVHLPEDLWICCPDTEGSPRCCPFCEELTPTLLHLAYHNYQFCRSKSLFERTFGRKDDFLQHVSHVHKVSPVKDSARLIELGKSWRSPSLLKECPEALHCGFCGLVCASYQARTDHVSRHFFAGVDMIIWWKDRIRHDDQFKLEDVKIFHRLV